MIKKTPPGNLWGDLSWALDCFVIGLSKTTGQSAADCEIDLLRHLSEQAVAIEKIPKTEYKAIGEILFKSLDKYNPCSKLINPDSVVANLPEDLRIKFRLKKELSQAEYLVIADEICKALIVKAWLKHDPEKAGEAYISGEILTSKALHGAFIQARTNILWDKRTKTSNTNKNNVNSKHANNSSKKDKLLKIWASGKYSSRDICAEEEYNDLGISFQTARKWLRNSPNPKSKT